jgi:hypothetical protein
MCTKYARNCQYFEGRACPTEKAQCASERLPSITRQGRRLTSHLDRSVDSEVRQRPSQVASCRKVRDLLTRHIEDIDVLESVKVAAPSPFARIPPKRREAATLGVGDWNLRVNTFFNPGVAAGGDWRDNEPPRLKRGTHPMKRSVAVTLFVALVPGLASDLEGQSQPALQAPQITPSSPQLEQRDQPVTADDLRILARAQDLLKDDAGWNRQDDRECQDDEASGRRSLFCALQKACIDVLGRYDHRRVALQEVRFAVEDATRGRDFAHRLRDFNNLPETRLADITRVLRVATERVASRLKARPKGA